MHSALEAEPLRRGLPHRAPARQDLGTRLRPGLRTAPLHSGAVPEIMDINPWRRYRGQSGRRPGHRPAAGADPEVLRGEGGGGDAAGIPGHAGVSPPLQAVHRPAPAGHAHRQHHQPNPAFPDPVRHRHRYRHRGPPFRRGAPRRTGGARPGPDGQRADTQLADAAHDHPREHLPHLRR